jgi:hypothetical protein
MAAWHDTAWHKMHTTTANFDYSSGSAPANTCLASTAPLEAPLQTCLSQHSRGATDCNYSTHDGLLMINLKPHPVPICLIHSRISHFQQALGMSPPGLTQQQVDTADVSRQHLASHTSTSPAISTTSACPWQERGRNRARLSDSLIDRQQQTDSKDKWRCQGAARQPNKQTRTSL